MGASTDQGRATGAFVAYGVLVAIAIPIFGPRFGDGTEWIPQAVLAIAAVVLGYLAGRRAIFAPFAAGVAVTAVSLVAFPNALDRVVLVVYCVAGVVIGIAAALLGMALRHARLS